MGTPPFPEVTLTRWRALVEKELAGKPFEKALVLEVLPGVALEPLYTERPALERPLRAHASFGVCMRHEAGASPEALAHDLDSGADALWIPASLASAVTRPATLVLDAMPEAPIEGATLLVGTDPLGAVARGEALTADLGALAALAPSAGHPVGVVSTLPYHEAGADAVDELALALSTGTLYLETLLDAGLTPEAAARALFFRVAVGRDTFLELCKLRALRIGWDKVLTAAGATPRRERTVVHAVCSHQTLTVRDPWVNMLRVTTQMFAAILGGADLVTPRAFDDAFAEGSSLGHRLARNTGLILRDESGLGRILDPAGGSYYFDSLTDTLARRAWSRFQHTARSGGVVALLQSGQLAERLAGSWKRREERIAQRKVSILGVSDFAHLGETLPHPAPAPDDTAAPGLPRRRDAEAFEALRLRAESLATPPEVRLLTLGTFAESRPRAGFAATFFAAGGVRTRESSDLDGAFAVCLCGTDERYAAEAAPLIEALRAAGTKCVFLAGRPDDRLEGKIDAALFAGGDAVAVLSDVLARFEAGA